MPVVDASVIVSWYLEQDANFSAADRWASTSSRLGEAWHFPAIILPEIAAAIGRTFGAEALAKRSIAAFVDLSEVHLHPVTVALATSAAALAASLRIRGCDAIYVALAAELDDVLVTFDRQQLAGAAGVIRVLQPS